MIRVKQIKCSKTFILTTLLLGCYEKLFTYIDGQTKRPLPISQIQSLIELSEYCEQTFHYECTLAPLTISNTDEEIDYAFWEDRHGGINNYFTGYKVLNIERIVYTVTITYVIMKH